MRAFGTANSLARWFNTVMFLPTALCRGTRTRFSYQGALYLFSQGCVKPVMQGLKPFTVKTAWEKGQILFRQDLARATSNPEEMEYLSMIDFAVDCYAYVTARNAYPPQSSARGVGRQRIHASMAAAFLYRRGHL